MCYIILCQGEKGGESGTRRVCMITVTAVPTRNTHSYPHNHTCLHTTGPGPVGHPPGQGQAPQRHQCPGPILRPTGYAIISCAAMTWLAGQSGALCHVYDGRGVLASIHNHTIATARAHPRTPFTYHTTHPNHNPTQTPSKPTRVHRLPRPHRLRARQRHRSAGRVGAAGRFPAGLLGIRAAAQGVLPYV